MTGFLKKLKRRSNNFSAIIATATALVFFGAMVLFTKYVHIYGEEFYAEPKCDIEGYNYRICKICGEIERYNFVDVKGHKYSDWIVTTEPGEVLPGYGHFRCESCYNTIYDYIDSTSKMDKIYLDVDADGRGNGYVRLSWRSEGNNKTYYVKLNNYFADSNLQKRDYLVTFYSDKQCQHPITADIAGYGTSGSLYLLGCGSDATYARNAVNSELWAEILASRSGVSAEYLRENDAGTFSYKPLLLYYNGAYQGVYTLGEPINADSMALDGTSKSAILYSKTAALSEISNLENNSDMLLMYSSDGESKWIEDSFNNMVRFLYNAEGDEFVNGISNYIDVDAAIDYMIFFYYSYASNNATRNYIWTTFDGTVWVPTPYKLEATWGLRLNGELLDPTDIMPGYIDGKVTSSTSRVLYDKLLTYFFDDVAKRAAVIRRDVLTSDNVISHFDDFISSISPAAFSAETLVWPDFPSAGRTDINQIKDFISKRFIYLDEFFNIPEDPWQDFNFD